ncbi:RDD family protein [Streptomyces beihaiensis]|uniref:RDD family protein n=1 Tax=Streptomyces beihaiensis TaxID=2984495 RepID=A0ABT3U3L5_9ACTN|nr:RDD family protein [Streptomyces beihaiensis]MCX3063905.1 RDD family protein [Streptomyces beihaiensis]
MSELVTGEAVALELRPAKLPSRALAVLIDLVVTFAVYIAVTMAVVAATASLDDAAVAALSVALFLLVLVGIPIAVETLSHGRSLGKLACGLRVVRDDGGPIRFRHALVRGAVGVVEILLTFGVVACIASLVSARGRRVGDVFAGTLVVRERVPTGQTASVPPPPPWLVGRFSQLDLSAVPEELWLAVRQYLTRMGQLDPQVGWGVAGRLAGELAARTGTPAPSDVPPAAFLAAVVHERQSREAQRAFGGGVGGGGGYVDPSVGAPVAGGSGSFTSVPGRAGAVNSSGWAAGADVTGGAGGAGESGGVGEVAAPRAQTGFVSPSGPGSPEAGRHRPGGQPSEGGGPGAAPGADERRETPSTGFVPPA